MENEEGKEANPSRSARARARASRAGLGPTAVYGLVSVAAQAVGFLVLDLVTLVKLGQGLMTGGSGAGPRLNPGT